MFKKTLAIILAAALITVSGCNNNNPPANTTTESVAAPAEAWEYEMYIEDLDYYMELCIQNYDAMQYALSVQDFYEAEKNIDYIFENINSIENIIYPQNLEESHAEFLAALSLHKELIECYHELIGYMKKSDSLTQEDYDELDKINAKGEGIEARIREEGNINDACFKAKEAAFLNLPNGEYKFYAHTLQIFWGRYTGQINYLYEVFINGAEEDVIGLCDDALGTLSRIENMKIPESVKPYHDEIIKLLPTERELCQTAKTLQELYTKYQITNDISSLENAPADVQEQANECYDIINGYLELNSEYHITDDAVFTAIEFAESQAN